MRTKAQRLIDRLTSEGYRACVETEDGEELIVGHRHFGDETLLVGPLATLTTRRALQVLALARGMAKP
jgi:hypothetical protein